MNYCVIDIETVPDDLPAELMPEPKLGNLKDPAKIAEKMAEWEEDKNKAMSLHPGMCKIVYACVWSSTTGDFAVDTRVEDYAIAKIEFAINSHDIVAGFNHTGFDLPVVQMRAMLGGYAFWAPPIKRYSTKPYYDCCQILAGWERDKMKSLDWWARRLGLPEPVGSGADVYKWYKEGNFKAIGDHCRRDVEITNALFLKMRTYWRP